MLKKIFNDTFQRTEEESAAWMREQPRVANRKVIVICITTALVLTCIKYFGDVSFVYDFLKGCHFDTLAGKFQRLFSTAEEEKFAQLVWWVGVMIVCYLIIPILIIRFVFRESPLDYGLKLRGAFKDWWLYAVMLAVMLPLVGYFSSTASFQARYPFYQPSLGIPIWPKFFYWELLYFGQFFALEFFFRGFVTLGLRHRFGYYSIFVMMIPYCMIHYGKPLPETIGAIAAGIVLGTLSLKSRSVLLGVCIHYSVAITMDVCALLQK